MQPAKISVVPVAGGDIKAFPFPSLGLMDQNTGLKKTHEKPSTDPSPTKQDFSRNPLALADNLDHNTVV